MRAWAEALLLLAIGAAGLALSQSEAYVRLMNPTYRPVTAAGGVLVLLMGTALLFRPRRHAGASALLVFLVFLVVAVAGRPLAPGVAPAVPFGGSDLPAPSREGYAPLRVEHLFEDLREEGGAVEDGRYVFEGLVYRTPALDAEGSFILLEPMMACCLADAIALGVRVRSRGPLPETDSWVYAFGDLRRLAEPIVTPRFRAGAILFTNVSSTRVVEAAEVVPHRALLPDVAGVLPAERCGRFREALASSDLAEPLRGEGPFTVFALLDAVLEDLDPEERRARLGDYVVPRLLTKADLYDEERLVTLSGRELRVEVSNGRVFIEGARILFGDQLARNGIVHVVHPPWPPR